MAIANSLVMEHSGKFRSSLYAIFAMFFWGMSFVWFRQVFVVYRPITIIFLRLVISGSLLLIYIKLSKKSLKVDRRDIKWFMLLAFTQPFCYFMGESFGLSKVSPTISSVIIATIPLFSPVAAFLTFRERVSRSTLSGIIISSAGIIIMLLRPDMSLSASPVGVGLLFFAVMSALAYSLVIRKLAGNYPVITIIALQNLTGAVYFLPFFLIFDLNHFLAAKPSMDALFALVELAFFASTLAYIFYIISIRDIGITRANVFSNLIPVFTGIASYFLLSEKFSVIKIIGMVLVMAGVIASQLRSYKRRNLIART
jgi:drug/metabolite transporter (DMT)-like permease